jgi:hypothetical protein
MNPPAAGRDRKGVLIKGEHRVFLDFGTFSLTAALFDTPIAAAFFDRLPVNVDLVAWGEELYGPMDADLGSRRPQAMIPEGGLAYTNRGNYFCIFFGQRPAWPVEFIGAVEGEGWRRLRLESVNSVRVSPLRPGDVGDAARGPALAAGPS